MKPVGVLDRADCTDKALDYTDSSFIIDCPGGCDKVADKVWGTGVYTDDSYICAAAIHDGRYVGKLYVCDKIFKPRHITSQ